MKKAKEAVEQWNSRERVLTAFNHEEPDRVPLFECWIESEIVTIMGGDPHLAREKLGLDCMPLGSHPPNTRAYGEGIDEWGRIFKKGQYGGGMVKTQEDLEKYTAPLSHARDWFFPKKIKETRRKYGEEHALYFAWHDCSLGLAYMSLGMEFFFQSLYEKPELVRAAVERSTEWTIALVEQANAAEVDFIVLGDDAADNSRPLISPRMFRELILPEYTKITKASDVPIIWHSDGNVKPLLPVIVEAGFAGVHSLESKAGVDLAEIKRQFGEKLVLAGNLDTTSVLCQSNHNLVRKDVERCIKQGAPGGGYLFSSSNSLFEGHNIDSIFEAYRHARKIGRYPIRL
ncbi:MAG: uroporphyrinogen decarboxylase family protein [Candidatus Odinarchaeota archaeon]